MRVRSCVCIFKSALSPVTYRNASHQDKVRIVRKELEKEGAEGLVVSALDEVECVSCCVVFLAFVRARMHENKITHKYKCACTHT